MPQDANKVLESVIRLGLRGKAEISTLVQAAQTFVEAVSTAAASSYKDATEATEAKPSDTAKADKTDETVQSLRTGSGMRCEVVTSPREFRLVMKAMGTRYEATIPTSINRNSLPSVSVTATSGESEGRTLLSLLGIDVYRSTDVPSVFRDAHEKAIQQLRRVLPEELLAMLSLPEAPEAPAASQRSPATATAPGATQEAPAVPVAMTLVSTDGPDVSFVGTLIAKVVTPQTRGRQRMYRLYETVGGNFVGEIVSVSAWLGEQTIIQVKSAKTAAELAEFFGYSAMVKQMFAKLGVNIENKVD